MTPQTPSKAGASQYQPVETTTGVQYVDGSLTAGGHTISFAGQEVPNPGMFFDPNGNGLLTNHLVEWVERAGPLAAGPGRSLWRYADGVWRSDGDSEVIRRVRLLLANRYRKTHAQGLVEVLANREQFIGRDDDLWGKINVANGVLNWDTEELEPHSAKYPFTWQIPVAWSPNAASPLFDSWLHEVFPGTNTSGNSPGHKLAFEVLGYALLGNNLLHKAVILQGGGRNGKGTFLRVLTELCGSENTSSVSLQAIAADKYATAELFGKLANVMGDLDGSSIRYTDRLKQLTGGDDMYAQRKYQQPFKFVATAFPIFAANELPRPERDFTEGFFSRFMIVPFTKGFFPEGVADPFIERELFGELPGILWNSVRAIRDLVDRRSFTAVEPVGKATKEYRVDADPVLSFVHDRVRPTSSLEGAWISRRDVYEAYLFWAEANGNRALSARKFYERLARQFRFLFGKGLATAKRQSDGYRNVALVQEEDAIEPFGSMTWGDMLAEVGDAVPSGSPNP